MTFTLDLSGLETLLYLGPAEALWRIFWWYFGWMPIAFVMLLGILEVWHKYRMHQWGAQQKFMLLAIDIPRNNAQSPRAVENLFTYFAGAHQSISWWEKWWKGFFQLGFSFEIVSIGGFIQFLIHTPVKFRSLVESAVYSQYPDAEIYEVEDYTEMAPHVYPDEEYDLWGAEFIQTADPVLPIRTYPEFEHKMGEPEVQWKDPLASLMDLMSSLQKGEQLWYQLVVIPIDTSWVRRRDLFISKILKEKLPGTKANSFVDQILEWMSDISEQIYSLWGDIEDKKKSDDPLKMMNLKPGQKKLVEGAELKCAKLGFDVSIRGLYFSRIEVMNKPKVVNGFVGYIKQFNTNDLNGLKPDMKKTATSTNYFRAKKRLIYRKNQMMQAYRTRSDIMGRMPWVMNVEELATLWHFPIDAVVKAPLVQRASAHRVEPPMALPLDEGPKRMSAAREPIFDDSYEVYDPEAAEAEHPLDKPTSNLEETKAHAGRPKFMDDEPSDAEAVEGREIIEEQVQEQGPNPFQSEEIIEERKAEPETPPTAAKALAGERGSPPPNLPFAD